MMHDERNHTEDTRIIDSHGDDDDRRASDECTVEYCSQREGEVTYLSVFTLHFHSTYHTHDLLFISRITTEKKERIQSFHLSSSDLSGVGLFSSSSFTSIEGGESTLIAVSLFLNLPKFITCRH